MAVASLPVKTEVILVEVILVEVILIPWPIPGTSDKFVMHQWVAISILQGEEQRQSIN